VILAAPSEETSEREMRNEPFIYYPRSAGGRAFEKPLTVSTVIQDDRLHWADAP
jgi:hypothetical protein